MSIAQKLQQIAENMQAVYDAGAKKEAAKCAVRHYVAQVTGDGTEALRCSVPFEPDHLVVTGFHPTGLRQAGVLAVFTADLRTFAYAAATSSVYNSTGTLTTTPMTAQTVRSRYSRAQDGTVTLENVRGTSATTIATFGKGIPYVVTACKYTDLTDLELMEQFVDGLTGSGTASLCKARIEDVFAGREAQLQALFDKKPDWTFTLM